MKPNKQNIINDILIELEKGIGYKDCFELIRTKSDIVRSTFSNYWNQANEHYRIKQETINKELASVELEQKKESLKKAILSRDERMEILTKIAKGEIPLTKPMVCDGVIQHVLVVPNWMDRKNAISELNKMDGSYAPTKSEVDLTGEIKTTQLDLSGLSIETLLELDKNFKNIENLET